MDNLTNVFSGDAFSVLELSTAIQSFPNLYGALNSSGLFLGEGITTTSVSVEIENGVLNLIPNTKRGLPSNKNSSGKREVRSFLTPHLPLDDKIYPSDVQNVRAFGSNQLQTVDQVVVKKLGEMSRKHDITHEYLKSGAIAGKILDADGTTTILNLFTEFGVTEKSVNFALTTETTDIQAKVTEVIGHIEDNLNGDTYTHVRAYCSPEFFSAFIAHQKVREAYLNYQNIQSSVAGLASATANPLRNDVRAGFFFLGVEWVEYRAKAAFLKSNGTKETKNFVAANTVRFVPVGTTQTFFEYFAPADWLETVNTIGQQKYAKVVVEPGQRWAELLSESNPLPLCLRPAVLVKGTRT
ncbi:MAG: major capsid protein [Micavibrio sp.]